jgi:hypothetical protein
LRTPLPARRPPRRCPRSRPRRRPRPLLLRRILWLVLLKRPVPPAPLRRLPFQARPTNEFRPTGVPSLDQGPCSGPSRGLPGEPLWRRWEQGWFSSSRHPAASPNLTAGACSFPEPPCRSLIR